MEKRDAQNDLALLKAATPGPWSVWHDDDEKRSVVAGQAEQHSDGTVAADWVADIDSLANNREPQEDDANAAFIAACPEMVEHWINRAVEAEAENAALVEAATELNAAITTSMINGNGKRFYDAAVRNYETLSKPHPGDPLREELERLRDEARQRKSDTGMLIACHQHDLLEKDTTNKLLRARAERYEGALRRVLYHLEGKKGLDMSAQFALDAAFQALNPGKP